MPSKACPDRPTHFCSGSPCPHRPKSSPLGRTGNPPTETHFQTPSSGHRDTPGFLQSSCDQTCKSLSRLIFHCEKKASPFEQNGRVLPSSRSILQSPASSAQPTG